VPKRSFAHRTETFGFDTETPWALPALRLVFAVPRAYRPLVDAWDARYPGVIKALKRLTAMGFLEHQAPVIVDTRTGRTAARVTPPLPRYRATAKGSRLAAEVRSDLRVISDTFPRITSTASAKVGRLLDAFDLQSPHSRYGLSAPHATSLSGLPERSGRWWVQHLVRNGYLLELDSRLADTREVVPEHWRVTRMLCRQLDEVLDAFPGTAPGQLRVEFRMNRTRFLSDIDPARVGITGATDFDHDIESQRILAAVLASPRCTPAGIFSVEPRISLPVHISAEPWQFDTSGPSTVFYQPDAEIREQHDDGRVWRSVIEYERFQSRRDAWSHIERFLGWLHTMTLPGEPAVLRFVVDTEPRVRSYVALIEAFADNMLDYPERQPGNNVLLAVSSARRVLAAPDPLDPRVWFRINLPRPGSDTVARPVLHRKDSPYDEYFSRA
jgi:hypothetical protein